VLIVRGDNTDIKSFADLNGKKAAQSLTSNFAHLAETNGAELVGTDGFDQSIQLLLTGRADATINDSLSFLDFKKHKPDADVKIAAQEQNADYSGVIVRKGDPELVAAINKALAEIKADGTTGRLPTPISARRFEAIYRAGRLPTRKLASRRAVFDGPPFFACYEARIRA
jgi:cystine transport system substrate-binding protein